MQCLTHKMSIENELGFSTTSKLVFNKKSIKIKDNVDNESNERFVYILVACYDGGIQRVAGGSIRYAIHSSRSRFGCKFLHTYLLFYSFDRLVHLTSLHNKSSLHYFQLFYPTSVFSIKIDIAIQSKQFGLINFLTTPLKLSGSLYSL